MVYGNDGRHDTPEMHKHFTPSEEIQKREEISTNVAPSIPTETREPEIPELKDYWRCFHCDFATTNRRDAEAHFGDRDDADEFKPICKWWSNMDDAERREQLQGVIRQMNDVTEDNDGLAERTARSETREKALEDALREIDEKTIDHVASRIARSALERKG